MSLQIGEIDLVQQGLNNEYKIERLALILEVILQRVPINFTDEDLNKINAQALENLRKKYPNSGLTLASGEDSK